jgi:triosephosphate isomerase
MKHLLLNLKRFDISPEFGGVNRLASPEEWGSTIVSKTQDTLAEYGVQNAEYVMFFPEAHLLGAKSALSENSPIQLGSQGVFRNDTSVGGNFGAFTTNLTANAAKQCGCTYTLIGHCEERNDKLDILARAGLSRAEAMPIVNKLLNEEIKMAQKAGLKVVYCIGELEEEQPAWQEVLGAQLDIGLDGVNKDDVVIAYEPIWSIGPGKTPADKPYITKIARFVKEHTGGIDVVYGGGLKTDNAKMLSEIEEIDGGLIALTRFSGEIGFYPDEYLEIIKLYLNV